MNDYFLKYKSLKKEVEDACLTIDTNNSSKLKEEMIQLKNLFDDIDLSGRWEDKVGNVFKEITSKCSLTIEKVINSIDNDFTRAEGLYKKLNEKLGELENLNLSYQNLYKSMSDLESSNIKEVETNILNVIDEIEDIKRLLDTINNNPIIEEQIEETLVLEDDINNSLKETISYNTNGNAVLIDNEQSVVKLANMCMAEQGSPEGAKFELSLLINQFKSVNGREPSTATELSDFMQNFGYGGGHWYAARTRNMANLETANPVYINAINDVLNGGRVLPSNVVEHDCFSDIAKIVVNGQTLSDYQSIRNHANYIRDNTVIYNKMGSVYTFYEFAPNGGDPFGYF